MKKNYNLLVRQFVVFAVLICTMVACSRLGSVGSYELERKILGLELDSVFSLDTIQSGDWTHFGVVTPYMKSDSLILARGIICTEADQAEIRQWSTREGVNMLLILRHDTLKKVEVLSRSVLDFCSIEASDSFNVFSRLQAFVVAQDSSVRVSLK